MKQKVVLGLVIFMIYFLCLTNRTNAHFIQSHLEMTSQAQDQLFYDKSSYSNNDVIVKFLNEEATLGKTYFEFILDGVRDADVRVNGIYNIDRFCREYNSADQSSSSYVYYNKKYDYVFRYRSIDDCENDKNKKYIDVDHWPIGDHAYNPTNGLGFHSQVIDNKLDEIGIIQSQLEIDRNNMSEEKITRVEALVNLFDGANESQKISNLIYTLETSNARYMGEHFYLQATKEWHLGNYINAMYNLGIALHLVQDMSVPTHVHVGESEVSYNDFEFESFVWNNYLLSLSGNIPKVEIDYNEISIGEYIHTTSEKTYDDISIFTPLSEDKAATSVKIGTEATAGAIYSFFCDIDQSRADVNGDGRVDLIDAMLTLRYSLGLSMIGTHWIDCENTGDVDCNNDTGLTDAMLILRYSLGLSMSGTSWCAE